MTEKAVEALKDDPELQEIPAEPFFVLASARNLGIGHRRTSRWKCSLTPDFRLLPQVIGASRASFIGDGGEASQNMSAVVGRSSTCNSTCMMQCISKATIMCSSWDHHLSIGPMASVKPTLFYFHVRLQLADIRSLIVVGFPSVGMD